MLLLLCASATPAAQPVGELSIESGGETGDLVALWMERFRQAYPDVHVSVTTLGSAAAAPGLTQGSYDLALTSRLMSEPELRAFIKRNKYPPTAVRVALGAVLVYVAEVNPLRHLRPSQLDAIFSVTRRCTNQAAIRRWDQLGLTERWAGLDIQMFGPDNATGIYDIFKQRALCGGDYRPELQQLPGGTGVDSAVADSEASIGFAEMGPTVAGVKALALSATDTGPYVAPTPDTIRSGRYPLSHVLYLYSNQAPDQPENSAVRAFVAMALSKRGQDAVSEAGLLPLTPDDAGKQLRSLP